MRLIAFRIKNFTSIIDSTWCDLSLDNITVLIGQNESGKTSILEALRSFFTSEISPDFIRSDGNFPEISCSFEIDPEEVDRILPDRTISPKLIKKIKDNRRINLIRIWEEKKASKLSLEEEELRLIFQENEEKNPDLVIPENPEDKNEEENPEPTQVTPSMATEEEFCDAVFSNIPIFEFFQDFGSLLPDVIDITDLESGNSVEGFRGAMNFLTIANLDLSEIKSGDRRLVKNKITKINKALTEEFRDFWRQNIGKGNKISIEFELKNRGVDEGKEIAGKPYLCFWINDGEEQLYLKQRSKGVRWFLSFYLQLKASAIEREQEEEKRGRVYLIDEPGGSLHARAQEDVLKLFESLKKDLQIIYTTHSPYLVDLKTLYRTLAAQRAEEDEAKSETLILNSNQLGGASRDTLSPIYTLMGADFSSQQVIQKTNNLILEEPSAYYYLTAFWKLVGSTKEVHFLPCTGAFNVPQFAYLFLGWGLKFAVVVDDDSAGRDVYKQLKENIFRDSASEANKKVLKIKDCNGIEDIFSKTDFKKYIIKDVSARYSINNSQYMKDKELSKPITAVKFMLMVDDGTLKLENLQVKTQSAIKELVSSIEEIL